MTEGAGPRLVALVQPSEPLGITAQVAVTLAGFAGIVVVFRPDSVHRWSALDKFRLQLLLTNSALPLAYSLLGLLLLTLGPPPAAIWRWCSGISFAAQLVVIACTGNPTRRISRAELQSTNKLIFYGIAVLGTGALVLQVINFTVWNRFWPFFALIFMHLIAALSQFVRMVVLPPHSSE
ncbi:MAG: hypothetical protein DME32_14785 [Verrucomicrobia bacterium]|nr:MAG: hypothetical protein DME32_14785 [Verrucomicrobiota bacterium]